MTNTNTATANTAVHAAVAASMGGTVDCDLYGIAIGAAVAALRRAADALPTPNALSLAGSAARTAARYPSIGLSALEGEQCADTVSAAYLALLEYARRQGLTLAALADGYTSDGAPLTLTVYRGRGTARRLAVLTGRAVARQIACRGANAHVNAQRTYTNNVVSVDPVSQGNDFAAPQALAWLQVADVTAFDHAARQEFYDALKSHLTPKQFEIARYIEQNYTQQEIAEIIGISQQAVSKHIAKIHVVGAKVYGRTPKLHKKSR